MISATRGAVTKNFCARLLVEGDRWLIILRRRNGQEVARSNEEGNPQGEARASERQPRGQGEDPHGRCSRPPRPVHRSRGAFLLGVQKEIELVREKREREDSNKD